MKVGKIVTAIGLAVFGSCLGSGCSNEQKASTETDLAKMTFPKGVSDHAAAKPFQIAPRMKKFASPPLEQSHTN